ncbi:C-type lectin 37Db-like [Drosophila nasuta]|uniref:C-type lectin 37Db-like n=1 Tax=Drosophila nasuta TaxID=42062 RepID=UPI00295E3A6A|nr:C-type lectin 37Db-like [Drosophila nasuta]
MKTLLLLFSAVLICTLASSVAGEKMYRILHDKITWMHNLHVCRRLGGELVVIESHDELIRLSNYLKQQGYGANDWFWTSGNDIVAPGRFLSVTTGNDLPYKLWSHGQPDNAGGNEHCVHLWLKDGVFKMNDWGCQQNAKGICQMRI